MAVPVASTSSLPIPKKAAPASDYGSSGSSSDPHSPSSSAASSPILISSVLENGHAKSCGCGDVQEDEEAEEDVAEGDVKGKGESLMRRAGRAARASLDGSTWRKKKAAGSAVGDDGREAFERYGMPSAEQILEAGKCVLVGESGEGILFSDLIREKGKVVVVFLRHLWCGLCQQYVTALRSATSLLDTLSTPSLPSPAFHSRPTLLYIILVSSGSPKLIPIYRTRLECPFPLYVDGRGRRLYKALGMTKKSLDPGREEEKGVYVKGGMADNVVSSTLSGLNMLRYPGSQKQLGGEFVFSSSGKGDSIECLYASRMSNTRNHGQVRDLFAAAGVELSLEDAESVFRGEGEGGYPQE